MCQLYCIYLINLLLQQTIEQWKFVYLISAAVTTSAGIFYVFFADASLQEWNNCENVNDKEMESLQKNQSKEKD